MHNKIKVKKYNIKYHGKDYEILIPKITDNSLWVGILESEDGNGILGTYKGLQYFLKSLALASRNPYSIIYLPIKNFLIPDVTTVARQVLYGKECQLDIVIASTKANLKIHKWKAIRNIIKSAHYQEIDIHYHFDKSKDLERYEVNKMLNGSFNDVKAGTFFIVHSQAYLIELANTINEWLDDLKRDKNYTLEYDERRNDFTFYDFFTNVWTFRLSKKYRSSSRFMCGFYLDCWDVAVMSRLLNRKVNLISRKEALKLLKEDERI